MKVAQHFSAGDAVSKGIRPGGTIEMVELWLECEVRHHW